MRLRLLSRPSKSVCYAEPSATCVEAWVRCRRMRAELVLVRSGAGLLGALAPSQLRVPVRGQRTVADLPLRGVTVLPALARTSEVLRALAREDVEAVLLVDGTETVSVILRAG